VSEPIPEQSAAPAGARRRLPRVARRDLPALLVLVVLAGLSVAATFALRGVVQNQERRLLAERATELASYFKSSSTQMSATLAAAGEAVAEDGSHSRLFTSLATPLTANGAQVSAAQRVGGSYVKVAAVGAGAKTGPLTAAERQLLTRATSSGGKLVFDFTPDGASNHLVEGIAVPGSTPTVVLLESTLPKARPVPSTKDSPYRELNVALYASSTPDPSRLLLISGAVPTAASDPVSRLVPVGADSVLITMSGRGPLVGTLAHDIPWLALGAGLLLAVVMAALIGVLSRRRAYALNLVEQRTRAMHQAQLAAEAANRSKSEFLSRMSHELRTPLNAVLGFSQLLELDDLTPDQEQAVGQITKGGRHLLDLINEILDISQIETGKLALSPEAVDVGEVVAESVALVQPLADARGIHLLADDAESCTVHVFADRQRLKQILLNLLGNGIKYNRDGGTVSISCVRRDGKTLRIQVTDTGAGIPAEQFGLLFTPFERLGAEQTTIEGTGIGLALSRRLAEVMGGTLDVQSAVGRGSTFWVELPVVEEPVHRVERLAALAGRSVAAPSVEQRPAVLHIEDNLSNIKLIERVLAQRPGVELIPAMQGRLGLELARQHQPALILLDLNLADVSGEEVLHLLRDDPATAQIPVAIVSADAMPRQVQRLLSGGATTYLTKPIDVRQLLELVDRSLEAYARRTGALTPSTRDADRD
jgi:signal transduction histidine kinase/CheY-like chemotaxis protein